MRILFVAIPDSIHVARWMGQFADQGWDIHLFPSIDRGQIHPWMSNITVYHSLYFTNSSQPKKIDGVKHRGIQIRTPVFRHKSGFQALLESTTDFLRSNYHQLRPNYRSYQLQRVVERIKPDIVHSMEFQSGAYLTLPVRYRMGEDFPPWIVGGYGSDIYLFGRLRAHEAMVRAVLEASDYYTCDCQRDVNLALRMGFRGEVLGIEPVGGGFKLSLREQFWQSGPVSERKLILIKGYQHWAGRALVALRALALCADALQGYEIAVHSPSSIDVAHSAELLGQKLGIPIQLIPPVPHEELLRLYGRARLHVGLSISDGASNSMLESIVMGAFPIQSDTACANEWIVDGENGLIVPPEDPDIVAAAIRRALQDDELVDRAAAKNVVIANEKLEYELVRQRVIQWYEKVYAQGKSVRQGR